MKQNCEVIYNKGLCFSYTRKFEEIFYEILILNDKIYNFLPKKIIIVYRFYL